MALVEGYITIDQIALRPPDNKANNMAWADRPTSYDADLSSCGAEGCHTDLYNTWSTSAHGSVSCENCHGPAAKHAADSDTPLVIDTRRELCEVCHAQLVSRPLGFPQIAAGEHYTESACISCHFPHKPGPPATITHEAVGDCLGCHGPVAPRPASAIPANHIGRSNDQCLNCHEAE